MFEKKSYLGCSTCSEGRQLSSRVRVEELSYLKSKEEEGGRKVRGPASDSSFGALVCQTKKDDAGSLFEGECVSLPPVNRGGTPG